MERTQVLIVDDHPLMRQALVFTIEAERDMEIIGEASNGVEALAIIEQYHPDIVLMDLVMPEMNGFEVIQKACEIDPNIRILVLSSLNRDEDILKAVQLGAKGYVTKNTHREQLLAAIRTVRNDQAYLPPDIATKLMFSVRKSQRGYQIPIGIDVLTNRQKEILGLLGQGLNNHQIAAALHISEATLRVHIANMKAALGFENRSELVVYAVRQKLD